MSLNVRSIHTQGSINSLLLIVFICVFSTPVFSQDVSNVDVKTMSESDVRKAERAMQDAGLTPQQAIAMARQRGATEQQIRDMQERLQGRGTESGTGEVMTDPVQDAMEQLEQMSEEGEQQEEQRSTREGNLEIGKRIFGAYLFTSNNLTFQPSPTIQTPKNYEIGIGDQIIINIWGISQQNYQFTVNLSGQILIPDVGPVYIAGMTFEKAEEKILQRLSSIYASMRGPSPQTFAQVSMGQLRSIQVNMVGDLATPGTYTLPATATVFNALYLSGGPSEIGSFRNIKIIRENEVVKTVDIYRFLIDADPSDNVLLKDQDIIFVPPLEKRVEITGEFKRNGLFELKEGENLDRVIRFAGGFTEDAYWMKLQIRRKTQFGYRILDVPLDRAGQTVLNHGDEVINGEILDLFENRVTIAGAVTRPGDYEWTEGMLLKELIMKADSVLPDAFQNRGIITRFKEDLTMTTIAFDVEEVLNNETSIILQPEDMVMIKSHFTMAEQPYITVRGEVLGPGQFAYADSTTLGDAIFMANGFTEGADSSYIEVARRLSYEEASELSDQLVHIFTFQLSRNLELKPEDAAFILQPFDHISVKKAPGFNVQKAANVTGQVKYAGVYTIRSKKQRISDLVDLAGGITPEAYIQGSTLTRVTSTLGYENVAIDLGKILNDPGNPMDLLLRNGDSLHIPEMVETVKVSGMVQNPFSITYQKGKTLRYYIDKTGGFETEALRRKVYVQYPNGETASTTNFILNFYPKVEPGSMIVVPEKPTRENKLSAQEAISISSALTSMALIIVTIINTIAPAQ